MAEPTVLTVPSLRAVRRTPLAQGPIVTRTPLRVSFAGGGTDVPHFYAREEGAVLSTAITQYIYVTVKRHGELFNEPIRLNYSETELAQRADNLKNAIARECLKLLRVEPPIYISTVADIPASSGLGSSSSFAVGLLNALHAYRGERISAGQLAEEAATVELEILQRPIGKQDHYAAAYGGMNFFSFRAGGRVTVESQALSPRSMRTLFAHLLLFWTGLTRDAAAVLSDQQRHADRHVEDLRRLRGHALQLKAALANGFNAVRVGRLLHETWLVKRGLTSVISNAQIDAWYDRAIEAGAYGGKVCGAGGGGFLLFVVPPRHRAAVRQALGELRAIPIGYEAHGSQVILGSAR